MHSANAAETTSPLDLLTKRRLAPMLVRAQIVIRISISVMTMRVMIRRARQGLSNIRSIVPPMEDHPFDVVLVTYTAPVTIIKLIVQYDT